MHGVCGRLLHVDLDTARSTYRELVPARLRGVLGGIGLGVSLLHEFAPAGIDPFSPAAPLILATAPLVGTRLTTTAKFASRISRSTSRSNSSGAFWCELASESLLSLAFFRPHADGVPAGVGSGAGVDGTGSFWAVGVCVWLGCSCWGVLAAARVAAS